MNHDCIDSEQIEIYLLCSRVMRILDGLMGWSGRRMRMELCTDVIMLTSYLELPRQNSSSLSTLKSVEGFTQELLTINPTIIN